MSSENRRRVLVTGAGSGLGRSIAEQMARSGDEVIGTVRDAERAAALTRAAAQAGLSLRFEPLELGSIDQIDRLVDALERAGGVEVVVHNAGFGIYGPVEQVDLDATARQFAVNLFGPLHLTRRLLPTLRAHKGRVIFIGSMAGRIALPFQAHYSATKAAIASISDALRMELAPFGVQVTCVEPGDFATGFTDARVRPNFDGSPYREKLDRCLAAVDQQERGGADPRWAAETIDRLSRAANPPARRPVGRWARTLCLLVDLLPDRLRELIVRMMYRQ